MPTFSYDVYRRKLIDRVTKQPLSPVRKHKRIDANGNIIEEYVTPGLGNRVYSTIEEAVEAVSYKNNIAAASFQYGRDENGALQLIERPGSGHQFIRPLEVLSRRWTEQAGDNARTVLSSFRQSATGNEALMELFRQGGLVIERKQNKALQFFHTVNGEEKALDIEQTLAFLKSQGIVIDSKDFGVLSKRLNTFFSMHGLSTISEKRKGFRTGVFDPEKLFDLGAGPEELGKNAVDAASFVSKNFMVGQIAILKREANNMRAAGNNLHADALLEQVKDLENMVKTGYGRFYGQISGLNLVNLNGADLTGYSDDKGLAAIMKGDFIYHDAMTRKYSVDILTPLSNLNKEVMINPRLFGRAANISPRVQSTLVHADAQTLAGNPLLFNVPDIAKANILKLRADIATLRQGNLPADFLGSLGHLRSAEEMAELSITEQADVMQSTEYMRGAQSLIDVGMTPRTNPALMARLLATKREELIANQMLVPDAIKGMMISDISHGRWSKKVALKDIQPGYAAFNSRTNSWAFSRKEMEELTAILGGSDQDDALNVLLRWDEASRQMKGIVYRSPNSIGEYVVKNIDLNDESIYHVLEQRGLAKEYSNLSRMRRRASAAEKKLVEEAQKQFLASSIPKVELNKLGPQLAYDAVSGRVHLEGIDPRLFRYRQNVVRVGRELSVADQKSLEELFAADHIPQRDIGVFSNARELLTHTLQTLNPVQQEALKQAGVNMELILTETITDTLTKGGELKDISSLREVAKMSEKAYNKLTQKQIQELAEKHAAQLPSIAIKDAISDIFGYTAEVAGLAGQLFGTDRPFEALSSLALKQWGGAGRRIMQERLNQMTNEGRLSRSLSISQLETEDPNKSIFTQYMDTKKRMIEGIFDESAATSLDLSDVEDFIKDFRISDDDIAAANILRKTYYGAIGEAFGDETKQLFQDSKIQDLARMAGINDDLTKAEQWRMVHQAVNEQLGVLGGDDVGSRSRVVLAMYREDMANQRNLGFWMSSTMPHEVSRAYAYAAIESGQVEPGTPQYESLRRRLEEDIPVEEHAADEAAESILGGGKVLGDGMSIVAKKATQRLMDKEGLRELFSHPTARYAGIGAAGFIGLGLVRGFLHKEPSSLGAEQGPQNMPGGNPYDQRAPTNMYSGSAYGRQNNVGVRYTVNTRGNYDQNALRDDISNIDNSLDFHGGSIYYASKNGPSNDDSFHRLMSSY